MNYRRVKNPKKIINYPVKYYDCNVVINGRWFTELEISQYYKTKSGRTTVNDEIIQELIKKVKKEVEKKTDDYYNDEPLYIGHRAYNLVFDYDEEQPTKTLLIVDCYRERKYDIK